MEANYPYAIQNQRGGKITVGPQPMREVKTDLISTSRSSQLWVNTRMFLVNMALSDILMCLTLPVTPYTAFTGNQPHASQPVNVAHEIKSKSNWKSRLFSRITIIIVNAIQK